MKKYYYNIINYFRYRYIDMAIEKNCSLKDIYNRLNIIEKVIYRIVKKVKVKY